EGFHATAGCSFKAKIDPCTVGGMKFIQPDQGNNLSTLSVYPNPASTTCIVSIELSNEVSANIFIMDMYGREVQSIEKNKLMRKGSYRFNLDISRLQAGIYYIVLQDSAKSYREKLVLSR